ncbi:MAG: methylmalonyl-CoA mutase family protein [Pseudomonadota bacterium]
MSQADITPFAASFDTPTESDWRALVDKALKGSDFEKRLVSKTADGLRIEPLYARRTGATPIIPEVTGAPWRVSARVDHPDVATASDLALNDLMNGVETLTLVFPGGRSARGFGIGCETVADLDATLKGVDLSMIRLRLDPAPAARIHAALVAALVAKRGDDPAGLDIEFGMNPIGSLTTSGLLPAPWAYMAEKLAEAAADLKKRSFGGPFVTCDTRPYHEAGASDAQELATALAMGVCYLRALTENGIAADEASRMLAFTVAIDADQFAGIAKLRALRRLWARVEEACGVQPSPVRINAETAWRMMSARDPWVNMLRTTMATFAAGIGGADTCTVLPYTSPLGLPDGFARRIARNQQSVLIEESNLWRVADPAAGAGGYEAMTDQLCAAAWSEFQSIESEGGIIGTLTSGTLQARIADMHAKRAQDVATRKAPLTGTSEFPKLDEISVDVLDVSVLPQRGAPSMKAGPPPQTFAEMVEALGQGAARGDVTGTLSPSGVKADVLPSLRLGEAYEALRDASDAHLEATGARPAVFLACLGPIAQHTVRSTWIKNLMAAGGIEAEQHAGFETADAAVDGFKQSGATIACICSSDAIYADMAVSAAGALKAGGAAKVLMAGRPGEAEADLKAAGVDGFVFAGQDMVALLSALQKDLGVAVG